MDQPYLALTSLTGSWTSSYMAALRNKGIRPIMHKPTEIQHQKVNSFSPKKNTFATSVLPLSSLQKPLSQQQKQQYLKYCKQIQFSDPIKQVNKKEIYENLNNDISLLNQCFTLKNQEILGVFVDNVSTQLQRHKPRNLRQLGELIKYRNDKYRLKRQENMIKFGQKSMHIQNRNKQLDLSIPETQQILSKLKRSKIQNLRVQNLKKQFTLQKYILTPLFSHKEQQNDIKIQQYKDEILQMLSQEISQDLLISTRVKKIKQLKKQEGKLQKTKALQTPNKSQPKSEIDQSITLLQLYANSWEELLTKKKDTIQIKENKQENFKDLLDILSKKNLPFQSGFQIISIHLNGNNDSRTNPSATYLSRELLAARNLSLLESQFARKYMCSQQKANQTMRKYLKLFPINQINYKWCQAYLLLRAGMIKQLKYFLFHENLSNQLPCLNQYLSKKLCEQCNCESSNTMDNFSKQIHFIVTGQCKYSCEQLSQPFKLNDGKDYIWMLLKIMQVNKQNYSLLKDSFQQLERQKQKQFEEIEMFQKFCEKNRNKLDIQWKFYQKICQQIYEIRSIYCHNLIQKLKNSVIGKRVEKKQTKKIISCIIINLLYLWSYQNLIQCADIILSQLDYSILLTAIIHQPRLLISDLACKPQTKQLFSGENQSVIQQTVAKLQTLLEKHLNFYEKQWNKCLIQSSLQCSQTSLFQHFYFIIPQQIFDYVITVPQPKQARYPTHYTMERNIKNIMGLEDKQEILKKFSYIYDFTEPHLLTKNTEISSMRVLSKFYHNNYRESTLSLDTIHRRSSLGRSSKRISMSTSQSRQKSFLNRASFRIEDYENQQSRNLAILLDQIKSLQSNIKSRDYTYLAQKLKTYVKKTQLIQKLLLETLGKIFPEFKGTIIYKKYLLLLVEGWLMLKEKKPKMTIASQQFKYFHQCLAKQLNSVGLNAHQWITLTKTTH